ncbi:hypothetical protein BC941DRAFT_428106 [Chlamydoabsidia padenii]|nr:hypothetical protein BC941DRAFT_428106 [Chlamydoabsidia padenii]
MEFKKLFTKVHDKVSNTDSFSPSPKQLRPIKDRKTNHHTPLTKWRGKWGDVSRPRFFSNNHSKKNNDTIMSNKELPSPPALLQLPCEPTITLSRSPIQRPRPHSTIDTNSSISTLDQQQPTSYTPAPVRSKQYQQQQYKRLSVPYVVDHLRSPYDTTTYSSDDYDDAGSFYNIPVFNLPPKRRVTWYVPKLMDDDTTDYSMEQDSLTSASTSISSSSLDGMTIKTGLSLLVDVKGNLPINETSQQDNGKREKKNMLIIVSHPSLSENSTHYDLVVLNVSNTMMTMREHQLELQMTKTRIENQRLGQQIDDMIKGTSTTQQQLVEENDRLENQIQQLLQQQHMIRSSLTSDDSCWRDEQEALRHTRAQLGLVEYLEGEPDVMAALNRFKKLLTILPVSFT